MTFLRPWLLWLLLLIPIFIVIFAYRAPKHWRSMRILVSPYSRGNLGPRYATSLVYSAIMSVLASISIILALAGPSWGKQNVAVEKSGLEVAILLDVSRSMDIVENGMSRLDRAKLMISQIIFSLPSASFSLVVFKGEGLVLVPMTDDVNAVTTTLAFANRDVMTKKGSDLEDGLRKAITSFSPIMLRNKVIFLLSDGDIQNSVAQKFSHPLTEQNIKVVALGIGQANPSQVPLVNPTISDIKPVLGKEGRPLTSALNPRPLEELASISQGLYIDANNLQAQGKLIGHFEKLAQTGREVKRNRTDQSSLFAGLAALFLTLQLLISAFSFRRRVSK